MAKKVDISYRTIIFTVFFLISLWVLFQIKEIIFFLFIGFIFMSALNPTVDRLEKRKIPRPLTVVLIYFFFLGLISVLMASIIPSLVEQTSALIEGFPRYLSYLDFPWLDERLIQDQFSQIGSLPQGVLRFTVGVFNNVVNILTLAVITFYLLMERKNLPRYLTVLLSQESRERAIDFIERVENNLGRWVRTQLFLMILIGLLSYLGLKLLGISFALPLAVLAALLEIVPNIGPTVAAIPAAIAGLAISPLNGLAVAVLYIFIQQLENSFIVPKVMEKGLNINPLVVIISLATGLKLGGIGGMALAIPVFLIIREAVLELSQSENFPKQ